MAVHLDPAPLSDQAWQAIRKDWPLPDEALHPLEDRIAMCAFFIKSKQTSKPAAAMRAKLKSLAGIARQLANELADIDAGTMMALVDLGSGPTPKRDALVLLGERQANISAIADWLQAASGKIVPGKRGADSDSLGWLVQQCDFILQHFGAGKLSRSYKQDGSSARLIKIVSKTAAKAAGEPPYGSGSIDEALKSVIKQRGENSLRKRA
jgi:hypothetical protein